MKFFIKKLPDGRIYLSQIPPTNSETVLKEIDAETWIKARERVNGPYYPVEGYGYFE